MKAKVKKAFPGRPDNAALARTIEVGEVIEGELAEVAVANKWATKIREKTAKPEKGPEQTAVDAGDGDDDAASDPDDEDAPAAGEDEAGS